MNWVYTFDDLTACSFFANPTAKPNGFKFSFTYFLAAFVPFMERMPIPPVTSISSGFVSGRYAKAAPDGDAKPTAP